ncbi:MAG TPA: M1 family aminopeptidase/hydrolase, partial [Sphingobacteriaceae bacterium]
MKKLLLVIPYLLILSSCQLPVSSVKDKNGEPTQIHDPHSFAEPASAVVKHLDLDIKVDFSSKQISGTADWTINNLKGADNIVFDTRNLLISKIMTDGQETTYTMGDEEEFLGRPLTVKIRPGTRKISITYTTSADAAALQWLTPLQTSGKVHPYLFTQSQAILARTWIPCQDSPGVRFTYNAAVTVPKELLAVMSAINPTEKNQTGIYHFKQPSPIPSYLMALAVGDIAFKAVDKRTGVYAEPTVVDKAAWEFADMGKMINAAEKLYGPYKWGRYDVLVLPPSFPFGGMENPMLTFATPTVLAGDRSLVSLIAHELAHNWSGNLVTNATWNDFWLNEGFTTYLERRIIEEVYGKEDANMQEFLGRQSLINLVNELGETNPDTRLKNDFTGRDPDEGVSDIAYEKGYSFLRVIEESVGRKKFDIFLKEYFDSHAFQSITTKQFLSYLDSNLIKGSKSVKEKINSYAWIYQPGMPANMPPTNAPAFKTIDTLIAGWKQTGDTHILSRKEFNTNEYLYFISHLPEDI